MKRAIVVLASAALVAGCGATAGLPARQASSLSHAYFRTNGAPGLIDRSAAEARLTALLRAGGNKAAGALIAHESIRALEHATDPTPVVLEGFIAHLPSGLPRQARVTARDEMKAALPRISRLQLEAEHRLVLEDAAKRAEEVYPQPMRAPLLHACEAERATSVCECALRREETIVPLEQAEGEPAAVGERLVGLVARCELDG